MIRGEIYFPTRQWREAQSESYTETCQSFSSEKYWLKQQCPDVEPWPWPVHTDSVLWLHLWNTDLKEVNTSGWIILLYIFLINWHYFVEICFHSDIIEFFVIFFSQTFIDHDSIYKSNKRSEQLRGWIVFYRHFILFLSDWAGNENTGEVT